MVKTQERNWPSSPLNDPIAEHVEEDFVGEVVRVVGTLQAQVAGDWGRQGPIEAFKGPGGTRVGGHEERGKEVTDQRWAFPPRGHLLVIGKCRPFL